MLEHIDIRTARRNELTDITARVKDTVAKSGVKNGIVIVYCEHTTAGITINERADPAVKTDILAHLSKLVPENGAFLHAEGNSDSHIKSLIVGVSKTLIIENGIPILGQWQAVFFCEFDGPRTRKVHIKVIGDE